MSASTTADRQYVWHPYYIDALAISTNSSGTAHYCVQDGNFNVTAAVDSSGAVVERYSTTPYGECIVLNADFTLDSSSGGDGLSDIANEFTYTGRRLDTETGLYQYRHRYYHAQLGRFVNRDPIGYEDGWSLYRAYFAPSGLDPMGLSHFPPPIPPRPDVPPGPDWTWRGLPPEGGPKGGWKGPDGESLHWDTSPHDNIGHHWDWNDKYGNKWKYDPVTGKWHADKDNNPNKPQPTFPPGTEPTPIECEREDRPVLPPPPVPGHYPRPSPGFNPRPWGIPPWVPRLPIRVMPFLPIFLPPGDPTIA